MLKDLESKLEKPLFVTPGAKQKTLTESVESLLNNLNSNSRRSSKASIQATATAARSMQADEELEK